MADLRTVVAKLATFRCAWTCEEIQALTDAPIRGVRAYLTALVNQQVLIRTDLGYLPGPYIQTWKSTPPKTKGPSTYGNSSAYREQRAVWDKLRQRDWEEGRKEGQSGKRRRNGQTLTSQERTAGIIEGQEGTNVPNESLSYAQAAEELGVSDKTVEREAKRGKIKTFRIGLRCVRISRAELDRYRDNCLMASDQ